MVRRELHRFFRGHPLGIPSRAADRQLRHAAGSTHRPMGLPCAFAQVALCKMVFVVGGPLTCLSSCLEVPS
jgi:hypothetical protein